MGEKFKAIREAKKAMSITPERGVIVVDYQDSPEEAELERKLENIGGVLGLRSLPENG